MRIASAESQLTWFGSSPAEELDLYTGVLAVKPTNTFLGVTFDPKFTFTAHLDQQLQVGWSRLHQL